MGDVDITKNAEIREVWADVDRNGDYVNIFENEQQVKDYLVKTFGEKSKNEYIKGYSIFDKSSNKIHPDCDLDFFYSFEDAHAYMRDELLIGGDS